MTAPKVLRVDLHMHSHYSKDSFNSIPDIIRAAQRRGMDVLCLTDHNTTEGALRLRDASPLPVIMGEEIATNTGEILAYFIEKTIPSRMSPAETIAAIREQNGIAVISHPGDTIRREAMRRAGITSVIDQVDGIEVFNSRCLLPRFNRVALELAVGHSLPGTAGSDAHTLGEIANAYVEIPYFSTRDQFLANLPRAEIHGRLTLPTVHFATALAKRIKRLRPALYGVPPTRK